MMFLKPQDGMSCHEAQLLMSLHMKDDPSLTREQREAFESHLMVCSACQQEYEEDKQIIALVKKYWGPISEGTRKLLEEGEMLPDEQMSMEMEPPAVEPSADEALAAGFRAALMAVVDDDSMDDSAKMAKIKDIIKQLNNKELGCKNG